MLSRRKFLSMASLLSAGLLGKELLGKELLGKSAQTACQPESQSYPDSFSGIFSETLPRTLILLQLSGGNDWLNTVIPISSARYYRNRPTLAIPKEKTLRLSDGLALHPALDTLARLYERGNLAIVDAVGFSEINKSHEGASRIWQEAIESVSTTMPHVLKASRGTQVYAGIASPSPSPSLKPVLPEHARQADLAGYLEALIDDDTGQHRLEHLVLDGFDTHFNQVNEHAELLSGLCQALIPLERHIEASRKNDRQFLMMIFSEFGRSLTENEYGGTDHGAGSGVILLGNNLEKFVHKSSGRIIAHCPDVIDMQAELDGRAFLHSLARGWFGQSKQSQNSSMAIEAPAIIARQAVTAARLV